MHKDLEIAVPEMVKDYAAVELKAFDNVVIVPFAQDKYGWTDPGTGQYYPPTMDYYSHLRGSRISDSVNFAVRIRLDHNMIEGEAKPEMADYVSTVIKNAIFVLASYSDCACTVDRPCGLVYEGTLHG